MGWHDITDNMVSSLNTVLHKYDITTIERIRHFMTQCMHETNKGLWLTEKSFQTTIPEEDWFNENKNYGYLYRGAGYIHLTRKWAYQAFATYMIREAFPELNIQWRSPSNTDAETLEMLFNDAVKIAQENNHDVDQYIRIVTEGANYVAKKFAWDTSGYFWSSVNNLNSIVDTLRPANYNDVDRVTDVVNKDDSSSGREARRELYIETLDIII